MKISTTHSVHGHECTKFIGEVHGSIVTTKHIGRDIMAGFKSVIGGEIRGYTEMMEEARKVAIDRMKYEAEALGANAVIGMRLQTSTVMAGASEVIAYGTAVVIAE
ncbi:MAG: hypothetical protein KQ78_01435 [Candidatus Izimaplasma bacterium HR2]|nr:MAG: hypothetical protein KQ78_01435 [Candidatus Izimaplasma bacterium HR2]